MITDNVVMWEIQHSTVDWDCFKTQTLLETLKILNLHREGILCIFGSRTFVPMSWLDVQETNFRFTQFNRF